MEKKRKRRAVGQHSVAVIAATLMFAGSAAIEPVATAAYADPASASPAQMSAPIQARGIFATRVKGYHLGIEVSNEALPVVRGRTDFPDGTQFLIYLRTPWMPDAAARAAAGSSICDRGECTPAFPVKSGGTPGQLASAAGASFIAGPFWWAGRKPFSSGDYVVDVYLVRMPGEMPLADDNARLANLKMARHDVPIYTATVHLNIPGPGDDEPKGD